MHENLRFRPHCRSSGDRKQEVRQSQTDSIPVLSGLCKGDIGERQLDASLLLIPCVGFLPVSDPRVKGTVAAIERRLLRDGFVMRYDTAASDDGLPAGEGAFLACSFWLADVYILQGRAADAERLFRKLIGL